jgi:hypothetical protein
MSRRPTSGGRPVWRLFLTVMLGLALASRLAVGATASSPATDAVSRLQSVMVLCGPGQGTTPPPATPHKTSFDDRLVFEQADHDHALPVSPVPLPGAVSAWATISFQAAACGAAPRRCRAAWHARGPPSRL